MNTSTRTQSIANLAALKQFIKEQGPSIKPDILFALDTKFGIVDSFLFERFKPDKNGIYSNIKIMKRSYNSMKELITSMTITDNKDSIIAYKPINDNYHYIFIRKLNKDNLEKYLILL